MDTLTLQAGDIRLRVEKRRDSAVSLRLERWRYPFFSYRVSNEAYDLSFDARRNTGRICVKSSCGCGRTMFCNALKHLMSLLVMRSCGIVLHACGVRYNGGGHLFLGPSGSGKSTVASVSSREHAIISQEAVAVMPYGSAYAAYALPYAADDVFEQRACSVRPVSGLYNLVKDTRTYIEPLTRSCALALCYQRPAPELLGQSREKAYFARFARLLEQVPCYRLHFLPDDSFWRCIDARREAVSPA